MNGSPAAFSTRTPTRDRLSRPIRTIPHYFDRIQIHSLSLVEDVAVAAGELAAKTAKPLITSALTPEYRREMIRVLSKRALLDLKEAC
jgi:hypothetical protein